MGALKQLALVGVLASASACMPARDAYYHDLTRALQTQRFADAQQRIEHDAKEIYGQRDELLLPLDRAMVAFAAGDYTACIAACEAGKTLADALWTKHVGEHLESYLFGDDRLPYVGEPFERVAIHLIEALAYAARNELGETRVEARAMQTTLRRQADEGAPRHDGRGDDGFAHLLLGLLALGDVDDMARQDHAAQDLTAALRQYEAKDGPLFATPTPRVLYEALCPLLAGPGAAARRKQYPEATQACVTMLVPQPKPRRVGVLHASSAGAGRPADVRTANFTTVVAAETRAGAAPSLAAPDDTNVPPYVPPRRSAAAPSAAPAPAATGQVLVVHLGGEVPAKAEAFWEAWAGLQLIHVPYPFYGPPQVPAGHLRVRTDVDASWRHAALVHNLGAVARATLQSHADGIHARAVARAVAAAVASDALIVGGAVKGGTAGGVMQLVGLGLGITQAVTSHADTRSWRTLPDRIELAAFSAPAGPLTLHLELDRLASGTTAGRSMQLDVPAGGTRFVVLRSL